MVPLQAKHSLNELKKVKKMIIGGSMISKTLEAELKKLPTKVYETYGMTETITHIAAKEVGKPSFTVLPNVTISYDDRNCLVIRAPRISNEVIITNDLVELVSENQFVFLGRYDNIVNSGGIKLIPEQIEKKLAGKIEGRYFVTGKKDEELGEKLILIIEGAKRDIDNSIYADFDKYEKPKEVHFVSNFIETDIGKIRRNETKDLIK